jgi:15-cis-phytoene synthase
MTDFVGFDPELTLAIGYARAQDRAALSALFALDATLGNVLRSTTEPLLGQMRLTWWWEALGRLDSAPAPVEPVLQAIAADVMARGVKGERLAGMIDGWEALLEDPLDETAIQRHGEARGAILFETAGDILNCRNDPLAAAGRGWALADLALHVRDARVGAIARSLAAADVRAATAVRWSRDGRALGALARLAALDLAMPAGAAQQTGSPRRVARMAWHRLTGR